LRWREIKRHLSNVDTILDIGGATGAFSVPLARMGYKVTHVDLSEEMLILAQQKSKEIDNIKFIQANATNLPFEDNSFDLVLNQDGAVSFCGTQAEIAIQEAIRVSKKLNIFTVSNRAQIAAIGVEENLATQDKILPAVNAMFELGFWHPDQFPDNHHLMPNGQYFGTLQAFTFQDLKELLRHYPVTIKRLTGLGSLTSLISSQALKRALDSDELYLMFLDKCEYFDLHILPEGPGTKQRAGIIIVLEKKA
jgi:SAM-dependent methyltransferase